MVTKAHQKMKLLQPVPFFQHVALNALTYSSPSSLFHRFFILHPFGVFGCFGCLGWGSPNILPWTRVGYFDLGCPQAGRWFLLKHNATMLRPKCRWNEAASVSRCFKHVSKHTDVVNRDPSGTLSFSSRIAWSHDVKSCTLPWWRPPGFKMVAWQR